MPYCPKCDMEFIDGITVCSDCKGPLVESKEVADEMKRRQKEEEAAKLANSYFDEEDFFSGEDEDEILGEDELPLENEEIAFEDDSVSSLYSGKTARKKVMSSGVYVKKSQKYDDLKSSAAAFLLVGGVLTVFSLLCWLNIIKLPLAGVGGLISRLSTTALGLVSLYVAYASNKSAKEIHGQIAEEETATKMLTDWFVDNYDGPQLDNQICSQLGELAPEELALKRFELIQDIIITNHDLADPAYVDMLSEEIYGKIFED